MFSAGPSLSEAFRLDATKLNALIYQWIKEFNPQTFSIDGIENHKLHLVKRHGRKYIVFPMCKDAESADNEAELPYFHDFIKLFNEKHKKHDYIFLIPIFKCRGRFGLPISLPMVKSMHAVLWVQDQRIQASPVEYNSQSPLTNFGYPNKRKELNLPNAGEQDQAFGKQAYFDPSCGFYAATYLREVLRKGNTNHLKDIELSVTSEFEDKSEFLRQNNVVINHNVYVPPQVYPDSAEAFLDESEESDGLEGPRMEDWVWVEKDEQAVSSHVACNLFQRKNTIASASCPDMAALDDKERVKARPLSLST